MSETRRLGAEDHIPHTRKAFVTALTQIFLGKETEMVSPRKKVAARQLEG